ncbi:nlrc3 [Nannochloropsis oceanica]
MLQVRALSPRKSTAQTSPLLSSTICGCSSTRHEGDSSNGKGSQQHHHHHRHHHHQQQQQQQSWEECEGDLPGNQRRLYHTNSSCTFWSEREPGRPGASIARSAQVQHESPLPLPFYAGDILWMLLSFMVQADKVNIVSTCRWLRAERANVLRELVIRQPQQGRAAKGVCVGSSIGLSESTSMASSSSLSGMQSCSLKAAGMLEGMEVTDGEGVEEERSVADGVGEDAGEQLRRQNGTGCVELGYETDVKQPIVSLLQYTPLVRRMRYRGEVCTLAGALISSATPRLSRLLALDLSETHMTPADAHSLAAAFAAGTCPKLNHLDLSDNPEMGEEGAQALGLALEHGALPLLQGLLLFGDKIYGGGLAIARAMQSGGLAQLEILDLSGAALGTACMLELSKVLTDGHCPLLEQLGMSDNNVEEKGVEALAVALGARARAGCAYLCKLHLGGNVVGSRGAEELAKALCQDGCGAKLALLELHSARLGREGICVIAEALKSGACDGLRELWLDDNTEGEEDGGIAVQDVMAVLAAGALPALEALGLNWTGLGSSGAAALASALTSYPRPKLHRLDLRSTSITGTALLPLVDALCKQACPSLRWLDLSGNALFLNGARELARALVGGAGKNLRRLDLHAVGLETEGMREIAQALKINACPELMGLGLALNRIGCQGAVALGDAMAAGGLPHLVGLEVHKNELGDEGVMAISNVLTAGACPLLLYLGMSRSRATDLSLRVLVEGIKTGPGLAKLERLNLQDNWISRDGLARLQETVALVAARGGRLRLEFSGNGAQQILRREAGWILNGTRRICVGFVVGGGAVFGALTIKLARACLEILLIEEGGIICSWWALSTLLVLLVVEAAVVGFVQSYGLVRAWKQAPSSSDAVTGAAATNAAAAGAATTGAAATGAAATGAAAVINWDEDDEEDVEVEGGRVPGYVIWAILAGDTAVAALGGMMMCWWNAGLLCLWIAGVIMGFAIVLGKAGGY